MKSASKVAFNTGIQYGKMIITILVTLYSTRLVLLAIGASDFGIYNLVAGVIAMLSFLNASMTISTQRYLSFYIGKGEVSKLKSLFSSSLVLHLVIAVIVVALLEIVGVYLFDEVLIIPPDRLSAAKIAFHCMVASTFFTINAVPYDASINAHEDLHFDAITGLLETLLKLGIAFWVTYAESDRLILFGVLTAVSTVVVRIVKSSYCLRKYEECRTKIWERKNLDKTLLKEMASFAGWNTFGALMVVGKNQGVSVILNVFFGTIVNAAFGIANQVNSQVNSFSGNMLKALNPQIIKSEGEGDRSRMLRLTMTASKFSFFLFSFFAIPLVIEMPYVLALWLKQVPENTVLFCRLVLIATFIVQFSNGIMVAMQSVGKIQAYTIVISILLTLNLPLGYFLFKKGYPPHYILLGAIIFECMALVARMLFCSKVAGLRLQSYLFKVIGLGVAAVAANIGVLALLKIWLPEGLLRLALVGCATAVIFPLCIWFIGIDGAERKQLKKLITTALVKTKIMRGKKKLEEVKSGASNVDKVMV